MTTSLPNLLGCPLATKRMVLAQISICQGCCCGNVARGRPEVPVAWLKQEWRDHGLAKHIQLTISGCLGPCDLPNVLRISNGDHDIWLGNFCTIDDYQDLAQWARQTKSDGTLAPLSPRMKERRFTPFHHTDS